METFLEALPIPISAVASELRCVGVMRYGGRGSVAYSAVRPPRPCEVCVGAFFMHKGRKIELRRRKMNLLQEKKQICAYPHRHRSFCVKDFRLMQFHQSKYPPKCFL